MNKNKILQHLNLKKGMIIADLGCGGLGYLTFPISVHVGKNGLVYAVDILKSNLNCLDSKIKSGYISNIKTVWADIEKHHTLGINDGSLDRVLLVNTLFQIKEHDSVLEIAARLLNQSGQILIVDWHKKEHVFGPPIHHRLEKQTIIDLSKKHNLKIINEFDASDHHYGIVFSK